MAVNNQFDMGPSAKPPPRSRNTYQDAAQKRQQEILQPESFWLCREILLGL
jgi:hypothetical protein